MRLFAISQQLQGLFALGFLATRDVAATTTTEPASYVPTEIYNIDFCRDRANDWQFVGGTWNWVTSGCKIKSDNSSYNMGWLGRRDPISLEWEDYSCKLEFAYSSTEDGSRGLVTYAQATDNSFEYLNGYECALVKSGGVDYLKLYKNGPDSATELSSTEVTISSSGVKYLEMEIYSQWKNCYLTDGDNTTTISATDTTYSEGSVGVKTSYAETKFKEIACYDLGTLAPTTTVSPTHAPSPLPTIADPTIHPTLRPTPYPTALPSISPTTGPTPYPSPLPTSTPSHPPTTGPTPYPSPLPTPVPTTGPTPYPSTVPSPSPTTTPTIGPTPYPSAVPSPKPSVSPSHLPTMKPSLPPTRSPTLEPTDGPTFSPSAAPSSLPTGAPSRVPSPSPSETPTIGPSPYPSQSPTPQPSPAPTTIPLPAPTGLPTTLPVAAPTPTPTTVPTIGPTPYPSSTPTPKPSGKPSFYPSPAPTDAPTLGPSPYPSVSPSPAPTKVPVFPPTPQPHHPPTAPPSHLPTKKPSLNPTVLPTAPTYYPTHSPTTPDSSSGTVSSFGTADIGFAVMGVVLLVACIVCCLAGIGYNSKRKKRERQNALAWDQISDSISEGGSLSEPMRLNPGRFGSESDAANPMQTDSVVMEALWPSALFGALATATATAAPYQAAATEEDDNDGASMWPGAVGKKSDKKDEPSMWNGNEGEDVSAQADVAYDGPEAEVSFFDSVWPSASFKEGSSWYGASAEDDAAPASGKKESSSWFATSTEIPKTEGSQDDWQFDGDAALNGDEDTVVAPVVADVQEDEGEEFHF